MISIRGLEKRFKQIAALKGINLEVKAGAVLGLVGPNACGKTTLIKSILGLVIPDRGAIEVKGEAVLGGWEYRRRIGYMPQNPDFPGNLTIRELLDMTADVHGGEARLRQELIELFGLGPSQDRPFGVLSGGTKQKVAAVSAFMFEPEILILDEPTVGLDPVAMVRLKELTAAAAKRGQTVILVSHIMAEVEQLVTEMAFLLEGKVILEGTVEDIKRRASRPRLEDAVVSLIEGGQ